MFRLCPRCAILSFTPLLVLLTTAATVGQELTSEDDVGRVESLIQDGRQALEEGKPEKAAKRFEKADDLAGGASLGALAGLAESRLRLGEYGEAIGHADRLIARAENDRQRAKGHNIVGLAYFGRAMEVEPDATTPTNPDDPEAGRERMEHFDVMVETYRSAADSFRRTVELSGGGATAAWHSWVDALYRARDTERAREVFDRFAEAVGGKDNLPPRTRALDPCLETASRVVQPMLGREGDAIPERVHAPQPQYTEPAREARVQGVVMLLVMIDEEGDVVCPRVLRGLPHGLTEAALETILQWKFEPARAEGEPVPVHWWLSVQFRMS